VLILLYRGKTQGQENAHNKSDKHLTTEKSDDDPGKLFCRKSNILANSPEYKKESSSLTTRRWFWSARRKMNMGAQK